MSTKLRCDSILAKLTDDQRADLYDWYQEHGCAKTIEMAAQPAPEGFGLQIHKTTLIRFAEAERTERRAQRLAELATRSDPNSGLSTQDSGLANLVRAARAEFAHAVYELSLAATQPDKFDRLERALHHIDMVSIRRDQLEIKKQELEVHRQSLVLDRDKFECNASRMALINIDKLTEIHRRPGIDDEAKIHLARKVCFGPVPGVAIEGVALPEDRNTLGHVKTRSASHAPFTPLSPVQNLAQAPEHAGTHSASESSFPSRPSVENPEKLSPQSTVLVPAAMRPGTLGHVKTHSAPEPASPGPVPMESPLPPLPPVQNSEKLSPQSTSSAEASAKAEVLDTAAQRPDTLGHGETHSAQEPLVEPRKMTAQEWIDQAKNPAAVRRYIFIELANGSERFESILKSQEKISIPDSVDC